MHQELADMLRHRLSLISDIPFRDRDPSAHLEALKNVSLNISAWTETHSKECDAKLSHYLRNSSFEKALAHLANQP